MRKAPVLAALLLASLGSGCSWFDWGDDEVNPPSELVDFDSSLDVRRVWSTNIGKGNSQEGINLSPSFLDGSIYAADYRGNIIAVDAEDGSRRWRIETETDLSAGPAAQDGMVLTGTLQGRVYAYSADDGSELWQAEVSSEVLALPVVADGVVIVRCIDGRVFGLDQTSGRRLWIYDRSIPLLSLRGNSTPLVRAGVAFIGYDDGQVAALRVSDGSEIWVQPVANAEGRSELDRLADIDGNMALVASDLYLSSYKGRMASLAASSGRLLWFKDVGSASGLVVDRTRLALSDFEGNLWLLDRRNGATLWKQDQLLYRGLTRPAIYGNYVVVGDFEGYLHWYDADSGQLVARQRIDNDGLASAPVTVGRTLYVLANNGDLVAYRAGGAI